MSLFGQAKRNSVPKVRRSPLPVFSGDSGSEKFGLSTATPMGGTSRFFTVVVVPVPRLPFGSQDSPTTLNGGGIGGGSKTFYAPRPGRYVRVPLPIPPRLFARIARLHPIIRIALGVLFAILLVIFGLGFRKRPGGRSTWNAPFVDPNTLVLTPQEVAKIWEWEVLSGHHPSLTEVPESVPVPDDLVNPVVPASLLAAAVAKQQAESQRLVGGAAGKTSAINPHRFIGEGPGRDFLTSFEQPLSHPAFPPRPVPGSVIDLDFVLEKCDFSTNKYVRDCLEILRVGGSLDNGRRVRSSNYLAQFRHLYNEDSFTPAHNVWTPLPPPTIPRPEKLSRDPLYLPRPYEVTPSFDKMDDPCDPEHPRIFHMFWAGPFSDKPYMAVMSWLYTQNLGLDKPISDSSSHVVGDTCRPQFWVWINPGPAAAVPNPNAKKEMLESLATNPWSAPLLDDRFHEVVKFKMWNTTEQLDGIPELKPYWRDMNVFNSGGNVFVDKKAAAKENKEKEAAAAAAGAEDATTTAAKKKKETIFEKVGSESESDYDRLSVILSDMARFVLTYRFGGIYLDADTLFLRDWEELWNYRGQFAYRWSWHQKYNTAILKLHKGSALCTFLFKTALENGLDFHPMTVSRYLKDAGLDRLLLRIPDALFDPAWLNMERYQRDRPPFPYFPEFSVFFSNDKFDTAGPEQLGYDGFFRGAYSYHFHNFWWLPFDPTRNWPDLGERFIKGENTIRETIAAAKAQEKAAKAAAAGVPVAGAAGAGAAADTDVEDEPEEVDRTDLSWGSMLKRTFEAYIRGERPNMYGEWIQW